MKIENNVKIIKEINCRLIQEIQELKAKSNDNWDEYDSGILLGYYFSLSAIKNIIENWHPHDTDDELQDVYKAYGIDCDIDKLCLGKD